MKIEIDIQFNELGDEYMNTKKELIEIRTDNKDLIIERGEGLNKEMLIIPLQAIVLNKAELKS
ncbi:MAG: hypothetical protein AABY22_00060 [Nanoarchaeota archaeon]